MESKYLDFGTKRCRDRNGRFKQCDIAEEYFRQSELFLDKKRNGIKNR